MSKIKSALGDVVDFEMMQIMAAYGANNPTKTVVQNKPTPVVIDPQIPQASMLGDSVVHTQPIVEKAVDVPPITFVEPQVVDTIDAKSESKKGNK